MKRKISICVFINGFHTGGIETVMYNYFSNMDQEVFDLHIVIYKETVKGRREAFERIGFQIHKLSFFHPSKIKRENLKEHINLFKSNKFDVVYNNVPENYLPIFLAFIYKIPARIIHSHNDYSTIMEMLRPLKRLAFRAILDVENLIATDYIACSNRAGMSVFGGRRINGGRVKILLNGFDVDAFRFDIKLRQIIRNQLEYVDSDYVLGHVGRFEFQQKNQDYVIEIFNRIHKKYKETKLLFVGDGSDLEKCKDKVRQLGLEEVVKFIGKVQDTRPYYMAMDCFVFPSRYEGLGIAGCEAQISGLPCIFSDNIPKEICIADATFLPIGIDSIDKWVKKVEVIKKAMLNRSEIDSENISKYDIKKCSRDLESFLLGQI